MSLLEQLFSVRGKTAVVTGGAKGVGAMITRTLAGAGARVIVVARDRAAAAALRTGDAGGSIEFVAADLSTQAGIEAAATEIASLADQVHILVNNSGIFSASPVEGAQRDQWDRELGLNLAAPFFLLQALLPLLRAASTARDPARVISIGSIGGLWGRSSGGAYGYGAAKAGLHHLTRMLAADLTGQGITVNAVAPGYFPSDMTDGFFAAVPGLRDQVVASIPAGRLGQESDIGGAVLFLASPAGAYVSGAVIPVEGAAAQA